MGFPEALIVMSPFGAVTDALMRAKLELLDETLKDVRNSLAKVKFSASAGPKGRLTPVDYARLFDPGFVSFVAMDSAKSNVVWEGTPERLIRDIQDACSRVEAKLPPDTRQQLENQLVSALRRLESGKPLKEQATKATRVVELMAHLFGSEKQTGAAPEELWQDIIFPLLHIGAPEKFPPLDSEEVELAKKGVEPLYLFVEVVPYMHSASDAGLLGEFDAQELLLPHPSMENSSSLRLIQLNVERLRGLLASFDATKTKEAIRRFGAYVFELSGTQPPAGGEGEEVLMTALGLIEELQTILATNKPVCLRRTTEAEAASEGALVEVRAALNGPRIILA